MCPTAPPPTFLLPCKTRRAKAVDSGTWGFIRRMSRWRVSAASPRKALHGKPGSSANLYLACCALSTAQKRLSPSSSPFPWQPTIRFCAMIPQGHAFLFNKMDQWHFSTSKSKISSLPATSKKTLVISKTVSRFFFLMPRKSHDKGNRKNPSPPSPCVCECLQCHHCLCWVLFISVCRLPLYSLTTFSC